MIYLDTHAAVWLYSGDISKFSPNARKALNEYRLRISPMVTLELRYLHEIGRLKTDADVIVDFLQKTIGLKICNLPFDIVIDSAIRQTWTRDPFDRIIVGHAAVNQSGLLTKDEIIDKNYAYVIW